MTMLEMHWHDALIIWSFVWIAVLNIPPGSTQIISAYRLNFLHGLISSIVAFACMFGYIHENFAAMASVAYFVVDFVNILLNDFVWKVKSYQTPTARNVEYFHHILCGGFGVFCQLYYKEVCTLDENPFIKFMLAELSTPFLIAWRYYPHNALGAIFAVLFFLVRIVYHGGFLIPTFMEQCNRTVSFRFGLLYTAMNVFFLVMIAAKLYRKIKGDKKEKKLSEGDVTKGKKDK